MGARSRTAPSEAGAAAARVDGLRPVGYPQRRRADEVAPLRRCSGAHQTCSRFGVRQDRRGRARPLARGARRGGALHGWDGTCAARRRREGDRCVRVHRLARDHGRAGQDPAPARARRHPDARPAAGSGGARPHRWRGDRSRGLEPVSVRGHRRARRELRRGDREHRHRRPVHDPRGELAQKAFAHTAGYDRAIAGYLAGKTG